jgi:hypothetical protein
MGIASKGRTLYALIVFLIGFIFGSIRVLLLAPRLGSTAAVCVETPVMLRASWFVCRWCVDRLNVPRQIGPRSDGAVASVVLMAAEFVLGGVVFRRSVGEKLAGYASVAGVIGLAAQIGFGLFPLVQIWRR